MDYAALRVAALKPKREMILAIALEGHAHNRQLAHKVGRIVGQRLNRRYIADPGPRNQRVVNMEARRVVGVKRGSYPALRPGRIALRQGRAY